MNTIVYRFLSAAHGLHVLQSQRLKVGRLLELNDPMDCSPRLINYPARPVDVLNDAFEQQVIGTAAKTIGLLCFSEAVRDPVVWSHYADSHRGIALGFAFHHEPAPFRVKYEMARARVDYNALTSKTSEAVRHALEQGFTTKAVSWSYEKEHRIFVPLDKCEMLGEHYFIHLFKSAFIQVVLGSRCVFTANDILRLLRGWSEVKVLRAKMSQHSYEVDLEGESEATLAHA